MSCLKSVVGMSVVLLCLWGFGLELCAAQTPSMPPVKPSDPPTTWWPDPSTGLMWAGKSYGIEQSDPGDPKKRTYLGFSWQQANEYCNSLQLGGYSGWRLPTRDEVKAATAIKSQSDSSFVYNRGETKSMNAVDEWASQLPYDVAYFKGGIFTPNPTLSHIWTSTRSPSNTDDVVVGYLYIYAGKSRDDWFVPTSLSKFSLLGALCTRPMESELLQIAKDAQVSHPVSDVETLKAYIPLNKARLAYQAGQYQESLTLAQQALAFNDDPISVYYGMGIAYGRLGQWGQALTNLESAQKIDKDSTLVKAALKWAKKSRKAAAKGRQAKEKPPVWD
jgi:tetratricopeptide (TPR) repeat protein